MNSMEFYTKLCSLKSMLHLMVCTLLYWISHRNDTKLYHINKFCGLFLPWHNKNFLLFHKHLQNSEERKKMLAFRWIDTTFERCNNLLDLERIWKEVTFDLGLELVTLHWLFGFRSSIIHKMWFFYLYNVVHFFFVWFAFMYSAVLENLVIAPIRIFLSMHFIQSFNFGWRTSFTESKWSWGYHSKNLLENNNGHKFSLKFFYRKSIFREEKGYHRIHSLYCRWVVDGRNGWGEGEFITILS